MERPRKDINLAIKETDDKLTTFLSARLEFNDNTEVNEIIDEYIALISIAATLAARQNADYIDVSEIV